MYREADRPITGRRQHIYVLRAPYGRTPVRPWAHTCARAARDARSVSLRDTLYIYVSGVQLLPCYTVALPPALMLYCCC